MGMEKLCGIKFSLLSVRKMILLLLRKDPYKILLLVFAMFVKVVKIVIF